MNISDFARLGGKARAKKQTAQERTDLARKAAKARWAKQQQEKGQEQDGNNN